MLAYVSVILSLLAASINVGWIPLPTGHWPGISLGLAAATAGILEIRRGPERLSFRILAWVGTVLAVLATLLGVSIYLGLLVAASRVG